MYKLKSSGVFKVMGRGTVYIVECPVDASTRTHADLFAALGPEIEINGVVLRPVGFELFCLGTPIRKGERMGVIVRP